MKLPAHPYLDALRQLNLPEKDFAIFGGGPMWAHGLRDKLNDLDVVARGDAWLMVTKLGTPQPTEIKVGQVVELDRGNIEVFNAWGPGTWDVHDLIDTAEIIDGIRFVKLSNVLKWKKLMGRPKDIDHVKLIEQYMHN